MIAIQEALDRVLATCGLMPCHEVSLLESLGRVSGQTITSPEQVPSFDSAAMDGFAVRAADLAEGRRDFPVVVEVPAGTWIEERVPSGCAARIMTGAPLPPGVDTVIPVEATRLDGRTVRIEDSVPMSSGVNIRRAGEDLDVGDVLVEAGSVMGPAEVGALVSVGLVSTAVVHRPRVAIIATGSELVAPGQTLKPGLIRNSNSFTAYGQVQEAGADPILLGIAPDDRDETRRLMSAALAQDVVITSGGVSVGEYDFVKEIQDELGVERRFWGVSMKPGKPLAFGVHGDTLVFGVPGNPVAAMVCVELFVRPALLALQGRRDLYRPHVHAVALEDLRGTGQRTELRRCRLSRRGREWVFATTGPQGSGILRSMVQADGLAIVPPNLVAVSAGDVLPVMLLEGRAEERPPFSGMDGESVHG